MDNNETQDNWDTLLANISDGMYYDLGTTMTSIPTASITATGSYSTGAIPNGGYITTGTDGLYTTGAIDTITISDHTIWGARAITNNGGSLTLNGDNAEITINGKSLTGAIAKLEERLNILVPNKDLEAEWDELRELGERYRKLEQEFEEKSRAWAALKKE